MLNNQYNVRKNNLFSFLWVAQELCHWKLWEKIIVTVLHWEKKKYVVIGFQYLESIYRQNLKVMEFQRHSKSSQILEFPFLIQ